MEDRLRGIREEILSRDYFEKIITRLTLEPPNTPPLKHEALVQKMLANTTITTKVREADTFQVTLSREDPKEVRDVTTCCPESSSRTALEQGRRGGWQRWSFLQGQLEVLPPEARGGGGPRCAVFEQRNVDTAPLERAAQLSRVEQLRGDAGRSAELPPPGDHPAGFAPAAVDAGGRNLTREGAANSGAHGAGIRSRRRSGRREARLPAAPGRLLRDPIPTSSRSRRRSPGWSRSWRRIPWCRPGRW